MKKLVVITGANSGVGLELSKTFASGDHFLLLLSRNIETIESLNLPNSLCKKVDVTDFDSFQAAVDEVVASWGPVDCLINNAGVLFMNDFVDQTPDQWRQMFDVNVLGVMNGIKTVIDSMKERKSGTIINIGSLSGHKMIEGQTVYCGSKHALKGITEGLRAELADHNVRVSLISPGAIETNITQRSQSSKYAKGQNAWAKSIGGLLDPTEVSKAALYIYEQPQRVCIREVNLTATRQVI